MSNHRVQFYDNDAFLVQAVVDFVRPARKAGEGVLVIATPEHLGRLQTLLGDAPAEMRRDGPDAFVVLDARDTLATFMVGGMPNERRFLDVVGSLVRQVSDHGQRPVRAFGEMVALLYSDGNAEGAARLEALWDKLAASHHLSLLCAYPMSAFPDAGHRQAFECICAAHSQVEPMEAALTNHAVDDLHRTVALLRQRANALDAELSRRHGVEQVLALQSARIAAMQSVQAELENLAGQDALTGLSNRRIFTDRLEHAVERATRTGSSLALIYIDLDDFKTLNDSHGHEAGDQLLKQVAARLGQCVRTADTVSRWGGDEFAVITEDSDAQQAGVLMQRIVAALGEACDFDGVAVDVSASVGLSLFPDDAADAHALVQQADAAMYRVKRARKAGIAAPGAKPVSGVSTQRPPLRGRAPDAGAATMLSVEAAAGKMLLSRPHVLKLVAEQRFKNVQRQDSGTPLIPAHEVMRVALEMRDC